MLKEPEGAINSGDPERCLLPHTPSNEGPLFFPLAAIYGAQARAVPKRAVTLVPKLTDKPPKRHRVRFGSAIPAPETAALL